MKTEYTKSSAPCHSDSRNQFSPILVFGHLWDMRLRVRFSGFPFEWDMAYNNLLCTTVQAVIGISPLFGLYMFGDNEYSMVETR
jgi:hypothetical protein